MKKIILVFIVAALILGACEVKPVNTTRTTFVVWPKGVLESIGITPRVTAADLIRQEGSPTLSASQAAAFENNPSQQDIILTPEFIETVVAAGGAAGEAAAAAAGAIAALGSMLGGGEPTSVRPYPQRPPLPNP